MLCQLSFPLPFTVTFSTHKATSIDVECGDLCTPDTSDYVCLSSCSTCVPVGQKHTNAGICTNLSSISNMDEEHPNKLCRSHVECMKKGSGSFCARYPNLNIEYGRCFASKSKAEEFFKTASNSQFAKDFLKMPTAANHQFSKEHPQCII